MNSVDDQLAIPQFKLSTSDNYGVHTFDVDGQLHNNRNTELLGVQIVATFIDENGKFLGSEYGSTSIDPIPPGQTVPFKIMLMEGSTSVPIDNIGGIKFRVSSMSDNFESFDQSSSFSSSTAEAVPALPAPPPPPPPAFPQP